MSTPAGEDVVLNMEGLIEIANLVNETECKPRAEAVLARAQALADEFSKSGDYAKSLQISTRARTGVPHWASTDVETTSVYGMEVESKHGVLAKAMGDA